MILDSHTHRLEAQQAIINVSPAQFNPQPGKTYAVGIPPWHSAHANAETMQLLRQAAAHRQVVAIGETGLDALRGAPLERQQQLFDFHISLAEQWGKPLVVHMVRTSQQVLKAWRHSQQSVKVMIHGMRSNERVAQPLIEAGFYMSYGSRFNPRTLHTTPLDHLLVETDDDPNARIDQVAQVIARYLGMTVQELLQLAAINTHNFLSKH